MAFRWSLVGSGFLLAFRLRVAVPDHGEMLLASGASGHYISRWAKPRYSLTRTTKMTTSLPTTRLEQLCLQREQRIRDARLMRDVIRAHGAGSRGGYHHKLGMAEQAVAKLDREIKRAETEDNRAIASRSLGSRTGL